VWAKQKGGDWQKIGNRYAFPALPVKPGVEQVAAAVVAAAAQARLHTRRFLRGYQHFMNSASKVTTKDAHAREAAMSAQGLCNKEIAALLLNVSTLEEQMDIFVSSLYT